MAKREAKVEEDEDLDAEDQEGEAGGEEKPALPPPAARTSWLKLVLGGVIVTVIAAGLGGFLGMQITGIVAQTMTEKAKATPPPDVPHSTIISGDMVLQEIPAVVTNLSNPSDTWIRLETAIVFANGSVKNPLVTAAEVQQDILAYARTMDLAHLEGPSALEHLREDLNERVSLRTGGQVSQLIIQSLIIQ